MRESFTKGENFEKYVLDSLFLEHGFILVHRTNNYKDNKERFSENTLKPDFKFRCLKTQREFYVEAKYRSRLNRRYASEIVSYDQYNRFISIEKAENTPIFFVIGFFGTSHQPKSISLFSLKKIVDDKLSSSLIENNFRGISPIDTLELQLEPIENSSNISDERVLSKKKLNYKYIIAIITTICIFFIGLNFYEQFNLENVLKEKTENYYQTVELGEIDELENYIAPVVNNWYDKSNLTRKEVIKISKAYNSRFPTTETNILWDTFKLKQLTDEYIATYELNYKIITEKKIKFKNYRLKITATWNKDFKLTDIKEERINIF